MTKSLLTVVFALCVSIAASAEPKKMVLGNFSSGHIVGWKEESFEGNTEYLIVKDGGDLVLQASSRASASGLANSTRIDLWQYPYLNWRWKIDNRLPTRKETEKSGDDYPVRLYVIVKGGVFFWNSKALNYVWSRSIAKESAWPNAYAGDSVIMLSVRDGSDKEGQWYEEKRNVLQDLQRYIDPKIRYIDGVALMTDTDDTHSFVNSFYGDIFFTNQ